MDTQVRVVAAENVTRTDYAGLLRGMGGLLRDHSLFAFGVREEPSTDERSKGKKGRWLGVVVSAAAPSNVGVTGLSRILEAKLPTVIITNDGEWRVRIRSFDLILEIFSLPWIPELSRVLSEFPSSEAATGHLDEAHFYAVVAKSGLERFLDLTPKVWWPYALAASTRKSPLLVGLVTGLKVEDLFRGKNLYRTAELEAVLVESFQEFGKAYLISSDIVNVVSTNYENQELIIECFYPFEDYSRGIMNQIWNEVLERGSTEVFETELLESVEGLVAIFEKEESKSGSPDFIKKIGNENEYSEGLTDGLRWNIALELSETPGINLIVNVHWPPKIQGIESGKLMGPSDGGNEIGDWLRKADERTVWATGRLWTVLNLLSFSNIDIEKRLDSIIGWPRKLMSGDFDTRLLEKIIMVSKRHGFLIDDTF